MNAPMTRAPRGADRVLTHARLVLDDEVVAGTLALRGGLIHDVTKGGTSVPGAEDLDGDFLLPGLVDLHTDNYERHAVPRPGVRWNARSALLSHDAQTATAGVTTVFDALCIGTVTSRNDGRVDTFHQGLAELRALSGTNLLRCEHRLHLRCEISVEDVVRLYEEAAEEPLLDFVSLMDHTPGVGQFGDLARYKSKTAKAYGMNEEEADRYIAERHALRAKVREGNRAAILRMARARDLKVASHDDRTVEDIEEGFRDGIAISEFPVSLEAARAARAKGMGIIAGSPNVVRGGSHSGNVAVAELIAEGLVDALASDYVPASMMMSAFALHAKGMLDLPRAVHLVAGGPARMVGLEDRGRIAPGLRADLSQVRIEDGAPHVLQVWRQGVRVA